MRPKTSNNDFREEKNPKSIMLYVCTVHNYHGLFQRKNLQNFPREFLQFTFSA